MNNKLIEQYNEVFDSNGKVKNCGRDACIRLMEMLSEEKPDINFGNTKTGFLNVNEVKKFFNK